ncbi:hypothetical protein ONZ45_g1733 [Pleurotus djamor]|nr:hypothetical protein ONZ45_g1733 [Pleurotus djamor]
MSARPPVADPIPSPMPVPSTQPTGDQIVVCYVIIAMAVIIFGFWNVPGVRHIINPLKLFTIGWHELCHITMAILTGGRVLKVTIDPFVGGATLVEGGHFATILAAGYVGSSLLGGVFILAGFDLLVAKIMSFVLGVGLVMPMVLAMDKLTIVLVMFYEGLLIGFWFIDHGQPLRDIADDRFFQKSNHSDATQFNVIFPSVPAHIWGALWLLFSVGVLTGFVILGITAFKRTPEEMLAEAANFLPT